MDEDIIIGKEYMSNTYGPFIILEDLGIYYKNNNYKYYKIQFKWSTYVTEVRKDHILTGAVRDAWSGINPNIIQYSNSYGPFKILKFNNNGTADIQFIYTNNIKNNIRTSYIKRGNIKDTVSYNKFTIPPLDTSLLQPNIREYKIYWKLYELYRDIKKRCYNINNIRNISYKDVRVCDRWLNSFDNFYNDAKLLPQYEKFERWPTLYQFDKDYRQLSIPKEQRIYSPETCMFLYYLDNTNLCNIEYRNNHLNELSSIYYGVWKTPNNNFQIKISINGIINRFGTYTNEIAAANMYNYIYDYYHKYVYPRHELIPLLNNVPYMSWNECMQYRIPSSRLLYTLTNEPTISIPEFIEKYKVTKDDILS